MVEAEAEAESEAEAETETEAVFFDPDWCDSVAHTGLYTILEADPEEEEEEEEEEEWGDGEDPFFEQDLEAGFLKMSESWRRGMEDLDLAVSFKTFWGGS